MIKEGIYIYEIYNGEEEVSMEFANSLLVLKVEGDMALCRYFTRHFNETVKMPVADLKKDVEAGYKVIKPKKYFDRHIDLFLNKPSELYENY